MAGAGQDRNAYDLAAVRRLEAAGFRAWPATTVHYDGAWAVRLTASHPSRRLNSVNPIDPGDHGEIPERIARVTKRFDAYGRPVTFRITPLAGSVVDDSLTDAGWSRFGDSIVMGTTLSDNLVAGAMDQIPLRDLSRFVDAAMKLLALEPSLKPGLSEVIGAIVPSAGLFVLEKEGRPVSTVMCVQDGEMAGLFEIATAADMRGRGYARRTVMSALKWAHARGARRAWLQVEADNEPAIALYRSIGLTEIYRYVYRRPAAAG